MKAFILLMLLSIMIALFYSILIAISIGSTILIGLEYLMINFVAANSALQIQIAIAISYPIDHRLFIDPVSSIPFQLLMFLLSL